MNVLRRVERGLEGLANGPFARVFKSDVQPVEIAAALQRELATAGRVLSRDRRLVPNVFLVSLSPHDYEKLTAYAATLTDDLAATTSEYAAGQGYVFPGPVSVELAIGDLPTGRLSVASEVAGAGRSSHPPDGDRYDPDRYDRHRFDGQQYHDERAHPYPRAAWAAGSAPAAGVPAYADAGYEQPPGSFVPGFDPDPGEPSRWETRTFAPAAAPVDPPRQTGRRAPFAELHVHGAERVPVEVPGAVIGRAADADVRVDDPGASRRHAEIRIVWNGAEYEFWLVDLHSTNGTVVDGQRVTETRLGNGSRITIGATTLLLRVDETRLGTG